MDDVLDEEESFRVEEVDEELGDDEDDDDEISEV